MRPRGSIPKVLECAKLVSSNVSRAKMFAFVLIRLERHEPSYFH